ncbi:hypothetical protein DFP73DRAFT_568331 [Morchella snyderi]|nr:hypothetical protein DFP73DRAFT_568331 [Morchella snyderi]
MYMFIGVPGLRFRVALLISSYFLFLFYNLFSYSYSFSPVRCPLGVRWHAMFWPSDSFYSYCDPVLNLYRN